MRKSAEQYFLSIAKVVAEQSTCLRAKVGAVLVDGSNNRIVSTGYSGAAPGAPHCLDRGCLIHDGRCRRTVHAEINALVFMRGYYDNLHLYCTHKPCYNCLKVLLISNVKKVFYINDYDDELNDLILKELPEERRPIFKQIQM